MARKTFREWFDAQGTCESRGNLYRGLSFDRAYAVLMRDNFSSDGDWLFERLGLTLPECTCGTAKTCWYEATPAELRRRFPKKLFRVALRKAGVRVPAPRKKVTK
jgi:hypothetical protein